MSTPLETTRRHWACVRLVLISSSVNRWRSLVAMLPIRKPPLWSLFLTRSIIQALACSAVLVLLDHRTPSAYAWLVHTALLLVVLVESLAPAMATDEQVFHRHRAHYWGQQWQGSDSFNRVLVDVTTVELALRSVGFLTPVLIFLTLRLGPGALLCCAALGVVGQLVFTLKYFHRSRLNRLASVLWYVLGAALGTAVTWLVIRGTVLLLVLSRAAVSAHGLGAAFVTSTNESLNRTLLAGLRAWGTILGPSLFSAAAPWACVVLASTIALLAALRHGTLAPAPESSFISRYVQWVGAHSDRLPVLARRDLDVMARRGPAWGHTDINLVLPVETLLIIGANAALLPAVRNPWITSLLLVVEAYVLTTAVHRNFLNHYRDVLEFTQDARMVRLLRQGPRDTSRFLVAKARVLVRLSLPVLAGSLALVAVGVACTAAHPTVWLLVNLVWIPLLFVLTLGWVLRGPYDAFRWMMSSDAALAVDLAHTDLRDVAGVAAITRVNKAVMQVVMYLITLGLLLSACLVLLSGHEWLYAYVAVVSALLVGLGLSNAGTLVEQRASRNHRRPLTPMPGAGVTA